MAGLHVGLHQASPPPFPSRNSEGKGGAICVAMHHADHTRMHAIHAGPTRRIYLRARFLGRETVGIYTT
eukprot:360958-Chlamydomonas_euryale.AAC.10